MKRLFNEQAELTLYRYWLVHFSQHFMITPGAHISVTGILKYQQFTYGFEEPVYKIKYRGKKVKKINKTTAYFSCQMMNQ